MNKEELIELIDSLNISKEDFTILSSGALVIRGIIDKAGDLDIAVTKKGLSELNDKFKLIPKENGWYKVNDNIDCIQDDMINKKEKYKSRIPIVKEYIKNKK